MVGLNYSLLQAMGKYLIHAGQQPVLNDAQTKHFGTTALKHMV